MSARIVLVDDEIKLLRALKKALEADGHEVFDFSKPQDAFEFIKERIPNLVVSDIRMAGITGLDLLAQISSLGKNIPCVLMTAYSSVETAVAAVKLGARDYLLKPFEVGDFKAAIKRILEDTDMRLLPEGSPIIIGNSAKMKEVLDLIDRVATSESTILLQGESGTGKELVARTLHLKSQRASKAFIPVNCSAIPETLFESEIFGHIRGSFTGAIADKPGLFEEAHEGTIFLDEIGDLTPPNQAKILRVLQDGTFKRVGDVKARSADVRIIAATNRNLKADVIANRFRDDLLYRINVVEVFLPPLRERLEDLGQLVDFLLARFLKKHRRENISISSNLVSHLRRYKWPGNIRELENVLERAVILKRSGPLGPEDVPLPTPDPYDLGNCTVAGGLEETMEKIEEQMILKALDGVKWNFSKAAEQLGVTRQNLHYKLKKYKIRKDES